MFCHPIANAMSYISSAFWPWQHILIIFQMNQGETSPPSLLTEADLIALMDKHGIGQNQQNIPFDKLRHD